MKHLQAMTRLAGLGSAYCSKGLKEPGVGQMTAEARRMKWLGIGQALAEMQRMPRFGPVWPVGIPQAGFGASGASAFTMTAAQALSDYLVTNNCAGCSDMTSQLRQLTFAFKAAYLTDVGISPQIALNMSNALAMTAYGVGTDQALKAVLGASAYTGGPCTDDSGVCLGNIATPAIPAAVKVLEQQFAHQIQGVLQAVGLLPQQDLMNMLQQGFAALINQIGFELAKVQPLPVPMPQPLPVPPPPQPLPVSKVSLTDKTGAAGGWTTSEKITAGIAAGVVLTGVALVVYNATKG
jgi:hypothetical protein